MSRKIGNVLKPFAQRRQEQGHNIQPEKQILAELPLGDQLPQIPVRRRDNANIGLDRRHTAHGCVLALLQHAQQSGLRLKWHIADFIEEKRPAFRLLKPPRHAGSRAGECPLFVAKKL